MTSNNQLVFLINSYLEEIERTVSLMKEILGHDNLLIAWKNREIEQEGTLPNGISYKFHGVGCFLIFNNYDINFDFGPNGRCDGFDEWRLHDYVSQKKSFPAYLDEENLKKDFKKLTDANIITCPRWSPSKHLFYYSSKL